MRKILNTLLLFLLVGLLVSCDKDPFEEDNTDVLKTFTVEGLSLDNEEEDGRSDYYSKIYRIIADIENHPLYPSIQYDENIDTVRSYYNDGVTKDEYQSFDAKDMMYYSFSDQIAQLIKDIPYFEQGFKEAQEFSYFDHTIITYANDNYIYYYQEFDNGTSMFEILVEEDNIKMISRLETDDYIFYLQNDFKQGHLIVEIHDEGNNSFGYLYEFYNYQTDHYELVEYYTYKHTLQVTIGDYLNGEIYRYKKSIEDEDFEITLLTDGYYDMRVTKETQQEQTNYKVLYNLINISGWDYYKGNELYLDENIILEDYYSTISYYYRGIHINQSMPLLSSDNYNIIGDSTYTGPITYDDITNALDKAESIPNSYSITYTEDNEVDYFIINLVIYTPDQLPVLFEDLIQ